MRMLSLAFSVLLGVLAPGGFESASAQGYPNRPVRIYVPFAAGGAVDTLARLLGSKLSEQFNQPVVVENRAGAGGNLAPDAVAKAAPDGYTILLTTNGLAISPALYRTLPFDVFKDFVPVTQVVASQLVIAANPKLAANSIAELIALARAKPGSLNYGSTGIGNPLHLTMEMLKNAAGIDIQPVPYRGDAPLNAALIAGDVQVAVVPMATTLPHLQNGLLKALAVGGVRRAPALPNVATVAETIPGFESSSWQGFFVPANTPRDIVMTIQRETARVLTSPDVLDRLKTGGNEAVGSTPDEFDARFRADVAKFAKIVKDARIPTQD
jgi:tripartite-type tricarboxylate transporter receptor subunit TctC